MSADPLFANDNLTFHFENLYTNSENVTGDAISGEDQRQYKNRTDNCGFTFADRSCPLPSLDEMERIETVCNSLKIQIDTIATVSLVFGMPGSALALLTVRRMPLSATTYYMGCLAVSDFISLVFGIQIYRFPDDGAMRYSEILATWAGRIFQTFSHWTLACICLERFVAVKFPLHKRALYTTRNTAFSIVVPILVSLTPFTASWAYYLKNDYEVDMNLSLTIMQNLFYILTPGVLIVTLSTLTALQLKRGAKRREGMRASTNSELASRMEADLTRMMLLTSFCFVVFTCPWGAINTYDIVRQLLCPLEEAWFSYFYNIFLSMTFLNHAINFYVYYACAAGFRKQFWAALCCKPKANGGSYNSNASISSRLNTA